MSDFDPTNDFFIISLKKTLGTRSDNHSLSVNKLLEQFKLLGYDVTAFNREEVRKTARVMSNYLDISNLKKQFVTEEDLDLLKRRICKEFRIPNIQVLASKSRKGEVVIARHLYFALLQKDKYGTIDLIGRSCGNRDHATVLHAISIIDALLQQKNNPYYESVMRIIRLYEMESVFGLLI